MKKKIRKILEELKKEDGWSYMETLIVIAVVLILTATVGFMAVGTLDKARTAGAKSQIESFCTALEAYYIDCGVYPTTEEGLDALRVKPEFSSGNGWAGPYLYKNVPKDPWGKEYEYRSPGNEGRVYEIKSYGADGMEGGEGKDSDITSWE